MLGRLGVCLMFSVLVRQDKVGKAWVMCTLSNHLTVSDMFMSVLDSHMLTPSLLYIIDSPCATWFSFIVDIV